MGLTNDNKKETFFFIFLNEKPYTHCISKSLNVVNVVLKTSSSLIRTSYTGSIS